MSNAQFPDLTLDPDLMDYCDECPRGPYGIAPAFVGFYLDVDDDGSVLQAVCEHDHQHPDPEDFQATWDKMQRRHER